MPSEAFCWEVEQRAERRFAFALVGGASDAVMYARDRALEGTFGERRHARATTLARPGSPLHSTTVRPWSSARRESELVS